MLSSLSSPSRRKSDKEYTADTKIYMAVTVAQAGALYAEMSGLSPERCTERFLTRDLVAADLLEMFLNSAQPSK